MCISVYHCLLDKQCHFAIFVNKLLILLYFKTTLKNTLIVSFGKPLVFCLKNSLELLKNLRNTIKLKEKLKNMSLLING